MRRHALFATVCALLLSGCSFFSGYHVPTLQGNMLTASMRDSIHVGMSKSTVRRILGSPVLNNLFSANKWYYAYTKQQGYGKMERRHFIITFRRGRVFKVSSEG